MIIVFRLEINDTYDYVVSEILHTTDDTESRRSNIESVKDYFVNQSFVLVLNKIELSLLERGVFYYNSRCVIDMNYKHSPAYTTAMNAINISSGYRTLDINDYNELYDLVREYEIEQIRENKLNKLL